MNLNLSHKRAIIVILLFVFSWVIRLLGLDYQSGDMKSFLIPWYGEIQTNGGIASLSKQVGNYNLLYQTLISFLTYINVNAVYLIKIPSILFDYILAFVVALIVKDLLNGGDERHKLILPLHYIAFFVILIVPTIVVNSAIWGQCDSMYASFSLATLFFLRKDSYIKAALCLGAAFACKLQTIFIIPFICSYLLAKRKYNAVYYLPLVIIVFWSAGFLAFFEGRSLLAPIEVYMGQTEESQAMFYNFPSFWGCLGRFAEYETFGTIAIVFTACLCIFYFLLYLRYWKDETIETYYSYAALMTWTVVLFLPCMHDRYAYLVDLLLIVCCFIDRKYIPFAVIAGLLSFWCYIQYLLVVDIPHGHTLQSVVYTLLYFGYALTIYYNLKKK